MILVKWGFTTEARRHKENQKISVSPCLCGESGPRVAHNIQHLRVGVAALGGAT